MIDYKKILEDHRTVAGGFCSCGYKGYEEGEYWLEHITEALISEKMSAITKYIKDLRDRAIPQQDHNEFYAGYVASCERALKIIKEVQETHASR